MMPWHSFYPGDYSRATGHLTLVQHGAYRLLLDHYYSTGRPLPRDKEALYRVCRAFNESERQAIDAVLEQFFQLESNGYHNKRADKELAKQTEYHERCSRGGRMTAEKRWGARVA